MSDAESVDFQHLFDDAGKMVMKFLHVLNSETSSDPVQRATTKPVAQPGLFLFLF